jgi:hypothetical protein
MSSGWIMSVVHQGVLDIEANTPRAIIIPGREYKTLPKKSYAYPAGTTVFDPIEGEVPVADAIATIGESGNLIVKVGDSLSVLNMEQYLLPGLRDGSLIRYACTGPTGLMVLPNNLYGQDPLVYIQGLSSGNFLVRFHELLKVMWKKGVYAIELTDSKTLLPQIASFAVVFKNVEAGTNWADEPINVVGSDHCQAGSSQKLYSIATLTLRPEGAALAPCPPGKERNPATNRCRTVKARKAKAKTLKNCPPDKIRNPTTNRCVKRIG